MIKATKRTVIAPPLRKRRRQLSNVKKVDIRRAVEAAQSLGLTIGGLDIKPDGTISISTVEALRAGRVDLFTEWSERL